jgi:hypothetical protein
VLEGKAVVDIGVKDILREEEDTVVLRSLISCEMLAIWVSICCLI